jgi:hypothetical protein
MTNHILAINVIKNNNKYPVDYLDNYSKELEKLVVEKILEQGACID